MFLLGVTATGASTLTPMSSRVEAPRMLYFAGDSITYGTGQSHAWGARVRDRYPARARDLICGHACKQTRVIGHAGQCLTLDRCIYPIPMLATFGPEVLDATPRPTEVVVEIGINELANVDDATYHAAYRRLVAMGAARGIDVHIATMPPTNERWPWHAAMQAQRLRVNDWIRATWPTGHIDFAKQLEGADHMLRPEFDSGDGLHPNAFGALRMADAVTGKGL